MGTSRTIVLSATVVLGLVAACMAALGAAVLKPAEAAFPGQNGRLVFGGSMSSGPGVDNPEGDSEIFTMNPDGTKLVQLTHNSAHDYDPAWSPDGENIGFSSNREPNPDEPNNTEVYVMSADGTNQRRVTDSLKDNWNPAWSPSGEEIAFQSNRHVTNTEIYVVRVDGTDERRLTNNTASDLMPDWSPSGEEIAFYRSIVGESDSDIFLMNSDGTNQRRLIDTPGYDYDPDWSPDGGEITFQSGNESLYKIRADSTGLTNLTNSPSVTWDLVFSPSWAPDGKTIAFSGMRVVGHDPIDGLPIRESGIYRINPDGSGLTKIPGTVSLGGNYGLEWQPKLPDTTSPTVTGTVPTGTNVDRTTNVTATFSEDMLASSINTNTFKFFKKGSTTKIAATVSYDPNTRTATLDPFGSTTTTRLARGTTYKAVVTTKATDLAGNQLDQNPSLDGLQQKKWLFTTKP
jgi:Tol biopolymer transport system component